jgi:L-histidine N-alpha-methyltransferase
MRQAPPDRLTIDVCVDPGELERAMAHEIRASLTSPQKRLPSKYFYDEYGSELFERITELPEYYQTRTELGILQSIAQDLIDEVRPAELLELGSGSSTKTRVLLDAMERRGLLRRYLPFDVSAEMLRESSLALLGRYPSLFVLGVVGDFQRHLGAVPHPEGGRLVIFLGSTIGNLEVDERREFLTGVRGLLGPGDSFLLGVDLVKDPAVLHAAYNDSAGVTAEFNRNILRVVNRGAGADFEPASYRHVAFYDVPKARIEMHLAPERAQHVRLANLDLEIDVATDETIWTEISCKFTRATTASMLAEAGLELMSWYTDPEDRFALALSYPS